MARRRHWRLTRQPAIYGLGLVLLLGAVVILYAEGTDMIKLRLPPLRVPVDLKALPFDALLSLGRMTAAYLLSLIFSLSIAYAAVSNRWAERIILPLLDLFQSIPVLGFFPAVVFLFVTASSGHRLALELSSIFLIFTSQAWNIAFGVYEAWSTLPREAIEATQAYGIRGWLGFRRVYWPACLPRLIYNSIASWSNGWYFLIACEIIAIGPLNYELPGLGNFLVHATEEGRTDLLLAGLGVLLTIVIAMELLLWRPLSVWSTKFRYELTVSTMHQQDSFMIQWWSRSPITRRTRRLFRAVGRRLVRIAHHWPWPRHAAQTGPAGIARVQPAASWLNSRGWWLAAAGAGLLALWMIVKIAAALATLLRQPVPDDVWQIPTALGESFLRLLAAYLIALAWTLPVAIWASRRERVARIIIPLAEIGASMPAMALFPLIVAVVVKYVGDMNAASIILLLTGMQWYLLFNLIVGATNLPGDLKEAGQAFRLPRPLYWRTVLIPAMVPSLITGSITAWGGGWNALIVSEYFVYHNHTYEVHGIGALLNRAIYVTGNGPMIVYTLAAMVAVVVLLTQLFWRRAYRLAAARYRFDY